MLRRRQTQSLRLDHQSRLILASRFESFTALKPSPIIGEHAEVIPATPQSIRNRYCPSCCSSQGKPIRRRRRRGTGSIRVLKSKPTDPLNGVLPVELLICIFLLCGKDDSHFSVTVSQVCRSWRRVAALTPSLWSKLPLDGSPILYRKRLRRSRGVALDIELVLPSRSLISAGFIQLRITRAVAEISRWRSFAIRVDGYTPLLWNATLSELCRGPTQQPLQVSLLESLTLLYPGNDDDKEFHLFGGSAPVLRTVNIYNIRLRWTEALFQNLVSLTYAHHGFSEGCEAADEVLKILKALPRLKSLDVRFPLYERRQVNETVRRQSHTILRTSLSSLRRLTLRTESSVLPAKELRILASKLHVPLLDILILNAPEACGPYSRKSVELIAKPFKGNASIRRVVVHPAFCHQRCLEAFVRSLPVVQELVIK